MFTADADAGKVSVVTHSTEARIEQDDLKPGKTARDFEDALTQAYGVAADGVLAEFVAPGRTVEVGIVSSSPKSAKAVWVGDDAPEA